MRETIKVLFLAAEAEPFIKIGGLADVAGSLPLYLRNLPIKDGVALDIRLVLPLHQATKLDANSLTSLGSVYVPRRGEHIPARVGMILHKEIPVYFIESDLITNAPSVYAQDQALDRDKYALFCLACLAFLRQQEWKPDIMHANDWHTSLALHALRTQVDDPLSAVHTVLTLHNLPYMGGEGVDVLEAYQLEPSQEERLPVWARTQPLPMGLASAERIVPVSPQYGHEILTPAFGCDLDDYLRARSEDISGILNGLDVASFNPETDAHLPENFNATCLDKRVNNKTELQHRLSLPINTSSILIGMVGRINLQKGIDIALRGMGNLPVEDWQFVLLGSGDPVLEAEARELQSRFPDRVRIVLAYDEALGRIIYGGADIFLMPSRYEPCGLAQMIAMRYGCVTVVRATGGLKDTVLEGETGFLFNEESADAMLDAIMKAISLYPDTQRWEKLQARGMSQDFSWANSAMKYRDIYLQVMRQ